MPVRFPYHVLIREEDRWNGGTARPPHVRGPRPEGHAASAWDMDPRLQNGGQSRNAAGVAFPSVFIVHQIFIEHLVRSQDPRRRGWDRPPAYGAGGGGSRGSAQVTE